MKKLILKIKRRYYFRCLLRHYLKGRRIQKELQEWGCEQLNCSTCEYNKTSNVCGIKNDMFLWSQKMDKILTAYSQSELKLQIISGSSQLWLIDSISFDEYGDIIRNGFDIKILGGADYEQKTQ